MNESKVKVIAFYLPQFHQMEINDKWWGKGFTEWNNVRSASALFEGHNQPRVPLNNNYYDLADVNTMKWQVNIAKEHGLFGFCFYHYWFEHEPIMEKPLLNYLNDKSLDFPFCFCWANESWTNGWKGTDMKVILEQKYGDKSEWEKHFNFLLPFFLDNRYIKEENCPLIVIYRPYLCDCVIEMLDYWKDLARQHGFAGLKIASQRFEEPAKKQDVFDYMDYHIEYQPDYDRCHVRKEKNAFQKLKSQIYYWVLDTFNLDVSLRKNNKSKGPELFDYDEMWGKIIECPPISEKAIAGGFVDWDNTPRHKRRGSAFVGVTPQKFEYYMKKQIEHMHNEYNNNYLFLFAWNEWGEGGYLEPDEANGFDFLDALLNAVEGERVK